MSGGYTIRMGTAADIETMCRHRRLMLNDMGHADGPGMDAMMVRFAPWALERLASGDFLQWFAIDGDGAVAAGASVWRRGDLPRPTGQTDTLPYVFNVYCERSHRRRGLARMLMDDIVRWARAEGYRRIDLHASDEGRPLYADMGFVPTNEMRLTL